MTFPAQEDTLCWEVASFQGWDLSSPDKPVKAEYLLNQDRAPSGPDNSKVGVADRIPKTRQKKERNLRCRYPSPEGANYFITGCSPVIKQSQLHPSPERARYLFQNHKQKKGSNPL